MKEQKEPPFMNTSTQKLEQAPGHEQATIATFNSRSEADRLVAHLRQCGIAAETRDDTKAQKYWFMVAPKAGFHVQVPSAAFTAAHKIYSEAPAAEFRKRSIRCPSCDSALVQYPALAHRSLLPTLFMKVLHGLHIVEPKYYCESCHFTWPHKGSRSGKIAHTDALGW
jgi:hypothetical protein